MYENEFQVWIPATRSSAAPSTTQTVSAAVWMTWRQGYIFWLLLHPWAERGGGGGGVVGRTWGQG